MPSIPSIPTMQVSRVNYENEKDAQALVQLLNAYSLEPLSGGDPLPSDVRSRLPRALAKVPGAYSYIVRQRKVDNSNNGTHTNDDNNNNENNNINDNNDTNNNNDNEGEPIALLNAFTGFSTFAAQPLINIHDVYIAPQARGKGALELLFQAIEAQAKALGCCKVTLEVQENNGRAIAAYRRLGYAGYDLGEEGGKALFWQKKLK